MKICKEDINKDKLPQHIAIIMDGNGRWAKQQGKKLRIFGHTKGVDTVKNIATCAAELGIKYLTLYTFSTENWNRTDTEINALMSLLVSTIKKETPTLLKNNIKLEAIGQIDRLPKDCKKQLFETINATKDCNRMTMILALSYSSHWDIAEAVKKITLDIKSEKIRTEDIDNNTIKKYLSTNNYPNPELLIRTSGEYRISNFLLWEIAYTELYFTDVLWPDFEESHLYESIFNYQKRERRFGKTSEQLLQPENEDKRN